MPFFLSIAQTHLNSSQSLGTFKPKDIKVVSLLDKPSNREVEVIVDYVGFSIPNEFVVGYGLDYAGRYRQLPYVGTLKPAIYEES